MATLQKIRNKGPLIAFVIGFALLAFILGDLVSNSQSIFMGDRTTVAEIGNEKIDIRDFQNDLIAHKEFIQFANQVTTLNQEQEKRIREEVWNMIVREKVLGENLEDMGIRVSDKEVTELIIGKDGQRDPIMQQIAIFTDRQTRQFAPQKVREFFNTYVNSDEASTKFGVYLENIIRKNKARDKYQTLIAKGLNITKPEAKQLFKDRVHAVDFEYVVKSYKSVPDADITVSDSELKAYYEEHKEEYEQEHTRSIAYITFNIIESDEDRKEAKESILELKEEMLLIEGNEVDNMINFANANSDVRFTNKYYAKGEFTVAGIDSLITSAEVGDIIEPYINDGYYNIARIAAKVTIPDTVQASHILVAPDGREIADMKAAQKRIDSLKVLIDNGADFAKLAEEYSMDTQSGMKGGDLGKFTEDAMIKSFSDSCFLANTGDLKIVETQYGIHLIKITYQNEKREKVLPVIVSKEINPGKKTIDSKYGEVVKFASAANSLESFDKEVEKLKLTKKVATDLAPSTEVIAGLENPERILSWAFKDDTEIGKISEVFQSGEQFIVAIVTDIKEEGLASFENMKDEISLEVIKDKKAEKFTAEFKSAMGGSDLKTIAQKVSGEFNTAKNIGFGSSSIPKVGFEPRVIGTAVSMEKDKVSEIIKGENGVYILQVKVITAKADIKDEEVFGDQINAQQRLTFRSSREAFEALKEKSDIKDNRHKFF